MGYGHALWNFSRIRLCVCVYPNSKCHAAPPWWWIFTIYTRFYSVYQTQHSGVGTQIGMVWVVGDRSNNIPHKDCILVAQWRGWDDKEQSSEQWTQLHNTPYQRRWADDDRFCRQIGSAMFTMSTVSRGRRTNFSLGSGVCDGRRCRETRHRAAFEQPDTRETRKGHNLEGLLGGCAALVEWHGHFSLSIIVPRHSCFSTL